MPRIWDFRGSLEIVEDRVWLMKGGLGKSEIRRVHSLSLFVQAILLLKIVALAS